MTIRFIGFGAYLALLLALGSGVSLASSDSNIVGDSVHHHSSTFCLIDSSIFDRGTIRNYSPRRLALHCYCCGRDENGHCNHQCCDP
jgi:hypothetical protein